MVLRKLFILYTHAQLCKHTTQTSCLVPFPVIVRTYPEESKLKEEGWLSPNSRIQPWADTGERTAGALPASSTLSQPRIPLSKEQGCHPRWQSSHLHYLNHPPQTANLDNPSLRFDTLTIKTNHCVYQGHRDLRLAQLINRSLWHISLTVQKQATQVLPESKENVHNKGFHEK